MRVAPRESSKGIDVSRPFQGLLSKKTQCRLLTLLGGCASDNGQTSGSRHGTPFVDPAAANC